MVELRIEISDDIKQRMSEISIDWSIVIDTFIREKISDWTKFRSIVSKSKLTEEDALEIGKKINRGLAERYKKSVVLK
mgnify:CR=1 FL=1